MRLAAAQSGDSTAPGHRIERWLGRHRLAVIVAIVAASVGFRVVYFLQLGRGPCMWQHRWLETDMSFFNAWAREIAAGDWLTDRSLHPVHTWTRMVAEEYLSDFPAEAQQLQRLAEATRDRRPAAELLWERWYGGKQFHQEPLYPYLLAVTYTLLTHDERLVFFWQMLLGVLANVLIYLLGRRSFGDTVGTVAAALAVLYAPLMYYELILLREATMTFMGLACVWAVSWALDGDRAARWFAAGAVIGAAILLKSTLLLFLIGVLGALGLVLGSASMPRGKRGPGILPRVLGSASMPRGERGPGILPGPRGGRALAWAAGGLTLGCASLLMPAVARNLAVGCPALSLSSVGSMAVISANAEDFKCGSGFTEWGWRHIGQIMHRTGGRLGPAVVETLKTHRDAWSVLGQLWAKFLAVWHWYEIPNNTNFYFYSLHAPVLRWAPLRFVAIAPLAIVGLAASWRRWRLTWPLLLMLASGLAPLVVFGTMSRYRLSLVPILIIFAAVAAVRLVEWVVARRWLAAGVATASAAALALWMARPLPHGAPTIRLLDHFAVYDYYYRPKADQCLFRNDYEGASRVIAEGLAYEPEIVRRMGPSRPAQDAYESQLGLAYAQLRLLYADYLGRAGRQDQALQERTRAEELGRAAHRVGTAGDHP